MQSGISVKPGLRYKVGTTSFCDLNNDYLVPSLPDQLPAGAVVLCRWHVDLLEGMLNAIRMSFAELHHWTAYASTMPSAEMIARDLEDGDESFRLGTKWLYALCDVDLDEVVGCAGLYLQDDTDSLDIGYWVRSDCTGRGHATASVRALTDAAFKFFPQVKRIEIAMDRANLASAAIPRKLGYMLDREEDRPVESDGDSGRGFVWSVERSTWLRMAGGQTSGS